MVSNACDIWEIWCTPGRKKCEEENEKRKKLYEKFNRAEHYSTYGKNVLLKKEAEPATPQESGKVWGGPCPKRFLFNKSQEVRGTLRWMLLRNDGRGCMS